MSSLIQEGRVYKRSNEYTNPKYIYVLGKKKLTKENLGRNDVDNPLYLVLELWEEGEVDWFDQYVSDGNNRLMAYGLEDFMHRYELVEDV